MRVFLTGASGFVGGAAVPAFRAAGHEVLAMARSEASAAKVRALGATPVACSLGSVPPEALAGIDVVVHAAAYVEEWGTREQFWEANVTGTQQLLDAARAAGVGRFVHVSSEAVLFAGEDLIDVDESAPYPTRHRYLYSESKAEAERRVRAAQAPGFATLVLRPRLVWGPGDATVLPALRRMVAEGGYFWLDGGRRPTSTVHIQNVAHALTLALTRGQPGGVYFIADDCTTTIREFLSAYAAQGGVALPDRSLPGWLARGAAAAREGLWRLVGAKRPPPMTAFPVAMMSRTITVRTDRAKAELGYVPVIRREEGLA